MEKNITRTYEKKKSVPVENDATNISEENVDLTLAMENSILKAELAELQNKLAESRRLTTNEKKKEEEKEKETEKPKQKEKENEKENNNFQSKYKPRWYRAGRKRGGGRGGSRGGGRGGSRGGSRGGRTIYIKM